MPRPRLCVSLAVVMLLPSALPDRAGAQDAVPDSVAPEEVPEDSLGGAPEGAFPVPIVDARLTLLGEAGVDEFPVQAAAGVVAEHGRQ